VNTSWLDYLTHGGPTLFALIGCSLILVGVIFERWSALRAETVDHEWLLACIAGPLQVRDVQQALALCAQAPGAVSRVLETGLRRTEHARDELQAALAARIAKQAQILDKNMSLLGTMAVIAPFIGLFGTVLGIVRSFKDLGGSNPAAVNAGIAEALASTAAGLFVAILAVVAFNYFKNRVRRIVSDMHVAADNLVEMIVLARSGRIFPQDLAPAPAPAWTPAPAASATPTVQQLHWSAPPPPPASVA